jgi:hypothetical protein
MIPRMELFQGDLLLPFRHPDRNGMTCPPMDKGYHPASPKCQSERAAETTFWTLPVADFVGRLPRSCRDGQFAFG